MSHYPKEEKRLEARARRATRKMGLRMLKSRQRAHVPNPENFGHFMLVDDLTNIAVAGERFDLTAEDVLHLIYADRIRFGAAAG
jgi:hypothetical protein